MDVAQRLGATFMLPGNVYNYGASMPALLQRGHAAAAEHRQGPHPLRAGRRDRDRAPPTACAAWSSAPATSSAAAAGPGSTWSIVKSLRQGKLVYPGPTDVPHAWAYLPDLARAFDGGGRARRPAGLHKLHFAGHTLTGAQLLTAVQRAAGPLGLAPAKGWRQGSMPWPLMRAGTLLVPMWREVVDMAYLWRVPHALDGSALAAAVGELPSTPIDAALRSALLDLGFGPAETTTHAQTA